MKPAGRLLRGRILTAGFGEGPYESDVHLSEKVNPKVAYMYALR